MNHPQLDQARAWARDNIDDFYEGERVYAVCEVIQSLPDELIDAEKVRELVVKYEAFAEDAETEGEKGRIRAALYRNFVGVLEALLPAPNLHTLAELIEQGNDPQQYQWMQAISAPDSDYTDVPVVIVQVEDDRSMLMWEDGSFDTRYHQHITPLPDLPPLKWPAQEPRNPETPPAETLNNPSSGTPRNPRPEDVLEGEPWIVQHEGLEWVGVRANDFRIPWSITNMDGLEYRDVDDSEITLVSRLVPEDKP